MRKVALCLFLIACLGTSSCANMQSEYVAAPTKGWVIDKDTKLPVEGVVVVTHWLLEGGIHYGRKMTLMAAEAVTDKNGYYEIAGWGPLKNPGSDALWDDDPALYLFKRGYSMAYYGNHPFGGVALASRYDPVTKQSFRKGRERSSIWDGKTLELNMPSSLNWQGKPMSGGDVILSEMSTMEGTLANLVDRNDENNKKCLWRSLPRAFVEVHFAKVEAMRKLAQLSAKRLAKDYETVITNLSEPTSQARELGCPSPKEFFKEYLKDRASKE